MEILRIITNIINKKENKDLNPLFKVHVFLIAGTVGLTIWLPFSILFGIQPSPITLCSLALTWSLMIKTNPVWKLLWEKWTKK